MKNRYKRFKLKCEESELYFWVYMYDTVEAMQKESAAYDRLVGKAGDTPENMLGVVQPYTRMIIEEGKPDVLHKNVGIIRLVKKYLTSSIVSHEVLHAAFWIYRVENRVANFGGQCNDKEEDFAYLYGKLFANMNRQLYKHSYWQ